MVQYEKDGVTYYTIVKACLPDGRVGFGDTEEEARLAAEGVKNNTYEDMVQIVIDLYHSICTTSPKFRALTDKRKKAIKARLKEFKGSTDKFIVLFNKVKNSDFLTGKNDEGWKADLEWLMNINNMVKVFEGRYDKNTSGSVVISSKSQARYNAAVELMDEYDNK